MWSDEEAKELKETYGATFATEGQDAAVRAVAIRAIELAATRSGTMTVDALAESLAFMGDTGPENGNLPHLAKAFRAHCTAQGATVATLGSHLDALAQEKWRWEAEMRDLKAKVEGLEKERDIARGLAATNQEHLQECVAERDAARAEVERLKVEVARMEMEKGLALHEAEVSESRLAAVRAELGAHEQEDGPDLLATLEGIREVLEGDATNSPGTPDGSATMPTAEQHEDLHRITGAVPNEAKGAGSICGAVRNAPDGCGRPVVCSGRHTLRDGDHISETGEVFSAFAARHPCSPTCTHDDAGKVGHPERVKARSEAVKAIGPLGEDTTEEAAAYDQGLTTGYDNGIEAMRAACWEAVQGCLQYHGHGPRTAPRLWTDMKAAIEGVTP